MMFRTHLFLGFLLAVLVSPYLPIKDKFIFLTIATICSCFPDIDHAKSKISSEFPPFKIFSLLFRHRGITHSLFTAAILGGVAYYYLNLDFALGIFIGFAAHILGDALTKNGVAPLYPLTAFKIRGFITTGGLFEKIILYGIITGIIYKVSLAF